MNKQTYTLDQAKRKLEYFCAYRERCHKEVVTKLREMHMIPLAVDAVVVHLIENDFLNEERFSRSFARGKFRQKKWGRQRIVRELEARDISAPNIRAALKEIDENDYLGTFHDIAEKRWQQISDSLPSGKKGAGTLSRGRKKLADYLLYREWESHLVYEKVNELTR